MRRVIEEPVVASSGAGAVSETKTTHPAYAQIGASRVSGSTSLYDSDFRHNHFMTISIRRSELHRGLNRDMHFGREELIEVALSEAQWATFVSAPNMGSGVPCTIQHLNGEIIPGLPDPQPRADQFGEEMKQKLTKILDVARANRDKIADMGLPKGRTAELLSMMEHLLRELGSNIPFVASQFGEHTENVVEAAKQEIHGYMTSVIRRAGLGALMSRDLPLAIESKSEGQS